MVSNTPREELRARDESHTAYCAANAPKSPDHGSCSCSCHRSGLPSVTVPEPAFTDYRGAITNILTRAIRHVAIITQGKGTVRGNHYHPDEGGNQWLYLLDGCLEAATCPLVGPDEAVAGGRVQYLIRPGFLLHIPPWTAHAFLAVESSAFLALDEYSHAPERYSVVTKPWPLIPDELRI